MRINNTNTIIIYFKYICSLRASRGIQSVATDEFLVVLSNELRSPMNHQPNRKVQD